MHAPRIKFRVLDVVFVDVQRGFVREQCEQRRRNSGSVILVRDRDFLKRVRAFVRAAADACSCGVEF